MAGDCDPTKALLQSRADFYTSSAKNDTDEATKLEAQAKAFKDNASQTAACQQVLVDLNDPAISGPINYLSQLIQSDTNQAASLTGQAQRLRDSAALATESADSFQKAADALTPPPPKPTVKTVTAAVGAKPEDCTLTIELDNGVDPTALTVDWGDGSAVQDVSWKPDAKTAAHSYPAPVSSGEDYTITVTVKDGGSSKTATFSVPPKLATPANLASANVASTSFDLNWDAVNNATTYKITGSPGSIDTTASTNTKTLDGLTASTKYTVQVVASASGYVDSDPASIEVTTTSS